MKKRFIVIGSALSGAILLWLLGCLILFNGNNGKLIEIQNANTIYSDTLSEIADAQAMTLTISKSLETTVNNDVFHEVSRQTLSYTGLGTEDYRAALSETLSIDNYNAQITEVYSDGIGYVTVNEGTFSSMISPEDYQDRFSPAILLDPALYGRIIGFDDGDNYLIQFSQPVNAERWVFDTDIAIMDAKGTAHVTYDGHLTKSIYTLTYKRGNAKFQLTVESEVSLNAPEIAAPNSTAAYKVIEYLDGPRMLERATGYLMQADHVSARYNDSIYFEAFGDKRTQEIELHTASEDTWSALVETHTKLTNESKVGNESELKKTEVFMNNVYRSATNGAESVINNQITADDMSTYCKNQLIGTIMMPQYISGAQLEESETALRIVFSANESFAAQIGSNVCQTLYQKPELLNDIAQSSQINTMLCYLEVDKNTSLPIAAGIDYDGTFTIDGIPYSLHFKSHQLYDILSQTALEKIEKAGA